MYRLKRKIRNFFVWGWRMRDRHWWDYSFLLDTMSDFLGDMEMNTRKYSHHVGSEKVAHKIMVLKNICKRISDSDYTTRLDKEVERIFRERKFEGRSLDGYVTWDFSKISDRDQGILDTQRKLLTSVELNDIILLQKHMRYLREFWD